MSKEHIFFRLVLSLAVSVIIVHLSLVPLNVFGVWRSNWLHFGGNAMASVILAVGILAGTYNAKTAFAYFCGLLLLSLVVFGSATSNVGGAFLQETWMVWVYLLTATSLSMFVVTKLFRPSKNAQ